MTRPQSPTLVGHLKTLFGAGTLTGLGEGELLERFVSHRDETAFEEILAPRSDGARHLRLDRLLIRTKSTTPFRPSF